MRIAALGDLHFRRGGGAELERRLEGIAGDADLVCLAGDLTDGGEAGEGRELAGVLGRLGVPTVAVLGNHDHERGEMAAIREAILAAGVALLDGGCAAFGEVGVAGAKGFGGGFGRRRVGGFGEPTMKRFVREGQIEAMKLGAALAALATPHRIALMHYSPSHQTLIGESPEIYPFLGNSDLAEAADRAGAEVLLHGHAHFGRIEGRTPGGARVYNVSLPVLDRARRRWLRFDL